MKIFLPLVLTIMSQENTMLIFDFKNTKDLSNWVVIDDGVMGGLSKGEIKMNAPGSAVFTGTVRLENNGGFSSIRYEFKLKEVSIYAAVKLRVKGDGKSYQFRIKEKSSQRYSYIHSFTTSGEWETITIPFSEFYPGFRGNRLDMPNYSGKEMQAISILIGNRSEESFSLELDKIYLYAN
ncbi:MAG: CIA30 family protein [Arenibacter latericius]|nr:CIA30 family protein [Arenibacter latericius]